MNIADQERGALVLRIDVDVRFLQNEVGKLRTMQRAPWVDAKVRQLEHTVETLTVFRRRLQMGNVTE